MNTELVAGLVFEFAWREAVAILYDGASHLTGMGYYHNCFPGTLVLLHSWYEEGRELFAIVIALSKFATRSSPTAVFGRYYFQVENLFEAWEIFFLDNAKGDITILTSHRARMAATADLFWEFERWGGAFSGYGQHLLNLLFGNTVNWSIEFNNDVPILA